MYTVEIYDQYPEIKSNASTIVQASSSLISQSFILPSYSLALEKVESLYNESISLGSFYVDNIIKLNEGRAFLTIYKSQNEVLNRTIYIKK